MEDRRLNKLPLEDRKGSDSLCLRSRRDQESWKVFQKK